MKKIFTKAVLTGTTAIIIYLMAVNLILHLVTGWQYGLFFDEYYYYSMSGHLTFGYMDVPPVTGWLMALSHPISANMGAYYWGHGGMDGKCVIFVNMGRDSKWAPQRYFKKVEAVSGPDGVPYSTLSLIDRIVYVCRGLMIPADESGRRCEATHNSYCLNASLK